MGRPSQIAFALVLPTALLCACSASHPSMGTDSSVDGDSSVDADSGESDSGRPDSAFDASDAFDAADSVDCADEDEDGYGAASCGGGDCDDTDPAITPSFSECLAPDRVLRCAGGVMEEALCPAGAALCDGRTGMCAASACGDGVLHDGEACDDGNASDDDVCSATCEDLPCAASTDCPEDRPSCSDRRSDRRDDRRVYCRSFDDVATGALGARCSSDADCNTGWCDPDQYRCTAACRVDTDCPVEMGWCSLASRACLFGCRGAADCVADTVCTPRYTLRDPYLRTSCWPSWRSGCLGSVGWCTTNFCAAGMVCTTPCVTDDDCWVPDAAGPTCRPYPSPPTGSAASPPDWPGEAFGICDEAD